MMIVFEPPTELYTSVRNPYLHLANEVARIRGCKAFLDSRGETLHVYSPNGRLVLTEQDAKKGCQQLREVLEVETEFGHDRLFILKLIESSFGLLDHLKYTIEGLVEQKSDEGYALEYDEVGRLLGRALRLLGESPSILPSIKSRR